VTRRGAALFAAAFVATAVLGGCGSDDERVQPEVVGHRKTLSLVSARMIAETPAGSPQRTLLRWWRLMQFRAADAALELFTPEVQARLRKTKYEDMVYRDFGPWLKHARPRVVGVDRERDRAILRVDLLARHPVGAELYRETSELVAVSMERTREGWRVDDTTFFDMQSRILREGRLQEARRTR
jgi:hypothetical protein